MTRRRWLAASVLVLAGFALQVEAGEPRTNPHTSKAWACKDCHTAKGWHDVPDRVDFDHSRTGTPLYGAHARAACRGCHQPAERAGALPKACDGCHRDPHQGGTSGQGCDRCHNSHTWRSPRTFAAHDRTPLPLTGAHSAIDCRSCHVRSGRETYRGTPWLCGDCHGALGRQVRNPDHRLAGFSPGCQACHTTFAWAPARVNHAVWWPLEGQHAATPCASCHGSGVFRGTSRACETCHQGRYQGAHPDHAKLGLTSGCERCHTAVGWNVMKTGWHDKWFPTSTGDHKGLGCSQCHQASMRVGDFTCTACHAHEQGKMASEHGDVGGYTWQSQACLGCHPTGRAED